MNATLAHRPPRLADLPAAPLLAVAAAPWQRLQLHPAPSGAVVLEALGAALALRLEITELAELARPIALPPAALRRLRRLHPDAERLVIDATDGLLRLRTVGSDAAAVVMATEGDPLDRLPLLEAGCSPAVPVKAAALVVAAGLLQRLGAADAVVIVLDSPTLALEIQGDNYRMQLAAAYKSFTG